MKQTTIDSARTVHGKLWKWVNIVWIRYYISASCREWARAKRIFVLKIFSLCFITVVRCLPLIPNGLINAFFLISFISFAGSTDVHASAKAWAYPWILPFQSGRHICKTRIATRRSWSIGPRMKQNATNRNNWHRCHWLIADWWY